MGAAGIASGDTVYIGAGTYREVVTVAMTSAVAETSVIGDVDGVQTGDVGEVIWTAYTTNDKTAPSSSPLLDLSARDFLTFRKITLVGGGGRVVNGLTSSATSITFTDCIFLSPLLATNVVKITVAFGVAANWLFDRCRFVLSGASSSLDIVLTTGVGSDYDANIIIRNCLVLGGSADFVHVSSSGTSANEGGGVIVRNCTEIGSGTLLNTTGTRIGGAAFAFPCYAYNNFGYWSGSSSCLAAGELGAIVENYNLFSGAQTALSNVTQGANTIIDGSYAPLIQIGQEIASGMNVRPVGMPSSGSPLLGFGGNTPPSVDILNAPRPSGGASASSAVGAYERGNSFAKETGTVRTGSNAISITGPGYHDFQLPVSGISTTTTVYVRWDATYAGTKPKMQVLNGTEAGVADATATATGSSGAWEQLSLNFTPTSAGIVTIRLLSSDTNGGGKCFADDFAVA